MARDAHGPSDDAPRLPPRGAGVLLQRDVERVDLGEFAGKRLVARVEHRTLRIATGGGRRIALTFGRRRPVAVEVSATSDGLSGGAPGRYAVTVARPVDPWARFVRRVAVTAGASWVLLRLVRRLRRRAEVRSERTDR